MDSSYFDGLTKLHFPNDSVGYAVGFNGIILKITNANSIISSIETIKDMDDTINIYPNPATDVISIEYPTIHAVEIINYLGETIIFKETTTDVINKLTLDVSSLSSGVYIVKVANVAGKFFKK